MVCAHYETPPLRKCEGYLWSGALAFFAVQKAGLRRSIAILAERRRRPEPSLTNRKAEYLWIIGNQVHSHNLEGSMADLCHDIQTLELRGDMPDLNDVLDRTKKHWSFYSMDKRKWTNAVAWGCQAQGVMPMMGPIHIHCVWRCKNRRKDPDNISFAKKYIIDGLSAASVIQNDGWEHVLGFSDRFIVEPDTGVDVTLLPREEISEWLPKNL